MSRGRVVLNGVSGVSGLPLAPYVDVRQVAAWARGQSTDRGLLAWLKKVGSLLRHRTLGLSGLDPRDLASAGWGIVFAAGADPAVRAALAPLVEHRRNQLGPAARELGIEPGETWRTWLARHGAEPGTVDPAKLPYYLLLIGSPSEIPYELQQLLAVEYGVGRLAFESAAEYRRYAESLIAYEGARVVPTARRAVFWAPRHEGDPATELSSGELAGALAAHLATTGPFAVTEHLAEAATRANLERILRPAATEAPPALLFTASHGVAWPLDDARQEDLQGSLLCQDWPGWGQMDESCYCSAADVPADARVHGLVSFHFACHGAGTPQRDAFSHQPGQLPPAIAKRPFVAALPRRLLSHPEGGALAVIGHVDRAWGYSILGESQEPQLQPFRRALDVLASGAPVGYALKGFRKRFAVLSAALADHIEQLSFGAEVPDLDLASAWIERNDARNYVLLGDPAARLRPQAMLQEPGTAA